MRRIVLIAAALALSCSQASNKKEAPAAISTALAPYVLDGVPSDIKHPIFIDFEAKVHLIGYDLEPEGPIAPGTRAKLKLYWKCVSPLSEGWRLYTHLVDSSGKVFKNLTDVGQEQLISGSLRGHDEVAPSKWQLGKVYVDEQEFELPRDLRLSEFTILAGLWQRTETKGDIPGRDDFRLDPISGPSDSEHRGIVAHVKTGVFFQPAPAVAAPSGPAPMGGRPAPPKS